MEINRRQFIETTAGAALLPTASQASKGLGDDPDDPLDVRRDFPVVRDGLYLNSAYIAPIPVPVADAARAFAERKASRPIPLNEMLAKTDEVRSQFARLVGADADEIGFLFATSEGENIVASALDLKPGDNVVVDELHYETTFVLYRHLEKTRGISLRIVKHRDGRVVASTTSHAPSTTGRGFYRSHGSRTRTASGTTCVPRGSGARPRRAVLHRAVQALGMFPVDVRAAGVDCMTSGTYKWLLGGFGVAPFFIRRALLEKIRVDRLGALHVEKDLGDHRYEIYRTAKKFEYATLPFAEVYQLGAGLAYLERVGVDRIERHTVALASALRDGLAALGFRLFTPPDNHASIVSVRLDRNQNRAREVLDGNKVQVSFRENGSMIRVSPALFNTGDEIRRFLDHAKRFA